MDRPAFEKLVQNSLRRLPRRFKQKLHNIAIEIEDRPSPALLQDMGIESGTLFGLYQGVPLTERAWNYGNMLPDRIVIYQWPIEAAAKSNEVLAQLGPDIQWVESYVAANKTFCVYLAKDEAIIRSHAELSGFPATKITEVRKMIDPTTAGA